MKIVLLLDDIGLEEYCLVQMMFEYCLEVMIYAEVAISNG
jgi:hypothetical protein